MWQIVQPLLKFYEDCSFNIMFPASNSKVSTTVRNLNQLVMFSLYKLRPKEYSLFAIILPSFNKNLKMSHLWMSLEGCESIGISNARRKVKNKWTGMKKKI